MLGTGKEERGNRGRSTSKFEEGDFLKGKRGARRDLQTWRGRRMLGRRKMLGMRKAKSGPVSHTHPPPPLPAPPFLPRHKHNKRPKCPKLRVSGRSLQGTGCSGRLCRMGTHLAVKVFVPRLKTPRFNGGRGGKKKKKRRGGDWQQCKRKTHHTKNQQPPPQPPKIAARQGPRGAGGRGAFHRWVSPPGLCTHTPTPPAMSV